MLDSDVFRTIDKHPLFITPSCRTTFCLIAHVSLFQYSISSNVLSFRRTLAHISVGYPCISSSWTQWVKHNNRPNYSQEIEKGFGMSKFSLFKLPLFIFFLHEESCSSWCHENFNLFMIYLYNNFFFYKSKICMC